MDMLCTAVENGLDRFEVNITALKQAEQSRLFPTVPIKHFRIEL